MNDEIEDEYTSPEEGYTPTGDEYTLIEDQCEVCDRLVDDRPHMCLCCYKTTCYLCVDDERSVLCVMCAPIYGHLYDDEDMIDV